MACCGGMGGMMGGGGWIMYLWFIIPLLIFVALVIGGVLVIRALWKRADNPRQKQNAVDLLRDRYARGEINSEEFDERRRVLDS
jgi:putative membrane protein